jgi:hypothetical protein
MLLFSGVLLAGAIFKKAPHDAGSGKPTTAETRLPALDGAATKTAPLAQFPEAAQNRLPQSGAGSTEKEAAKKPTTPLPLDAVQNKLSQPGAGSIEKESTKKPKKPVKPPEPKSTRGPTRVVTD